MTEDEVDIEFGNIIKPPRTVAYRVGYGLGVATFAAVVLGLLALAGIGVWTVLR